jgi:hypothetical protein
MGDRLRCACCGTPFTPRIWNDFWEGRLDSYCYQCAWARCDAYPGECKPTPTVLASRVEGKVVGVFRGIDIDTFNEAIGLIRQSADLLSDYATNVSIEQDLRKALELLEPKDA